MKKTLDLIAAPTGIQPGGYVAKAYADRSLAATSSAVLEVEKNLRGWRLHLAWACPEPVRDLRGETDRFVDAAAIAVPTTADAPWISMGAPGRAIEGVLWRADREQPWKVRAEGLGTVQRLDPPESWRTRGEWKAGEWRVTFQLPEWTVLDTQGQLAVAIWSGASRERGGLKSVSSGWTLVKP